MVRIFIKFSLTGGISDIKIGLKSGNPKEDVLLYGGSGMRCMGNGKQWRPAVAKVIASMVESEQKAKGMMAQGFKMSDSQWEYAYRCFELMKLDILAHLFSADGVLKYGS